MKLHYFNQPAADSDDSKLALAKQLEHVPATCLLGGMVVMQSVALNFKPCDGCGGPRDRCKGTPRKNDAEFQHQHDLAETRAMLEGSEASVIQQLVRKGQ